MSGRHRGKWQIVDCGDQLVINNRHFQTEDAAQRMMFKTANCLDETRLFKTTSFEMHEDSQPMINAQKRNVSASRFKHMKTKHHYIRKLIFDGWCKLVKIPTKMNTADMATKILPAKTVTIFSKIVLGLQDDSLHYIADTD